ncbi:hypothetical protein ACIO3O_37780 [Streptomyces sp. NPDC087440]
MSATQMVVTLGLAFGASFLILAGESIPVRRAERQKAREETDLDSWEEEP